MYYRKSSILESTEAFRNHKHRHVAQSEILTVTFQLKRLQLTSNQSRKQKTKKTITRTKNPIWKQQKGKSISMMQKETSILYPHTQKQNQTVKKGRTAIEEKASILGCRDRPYLKRANLSVDKHASRVLSQEFQSSVVGCCLYNLRS